MNLFFKFPSKRQMIFTMVPAIFVLGLIYPIIQEFDMKIRWLMKEPSDIAKLNPLTGYLSNMGYCMWCATVAITLFTAVLIYRKTSTRKFWFYLSTGIFSAFLLLDDMFMFHESLFPKYFRFGEDTFYIIYTVSTLAFFIIFSREIIKTNYVSLLIAIGLMAASLCCDYLQNIWLWELGQWEYLLEEGLKWFGLVWWCSYFVQTCFGTIRGMLSTPTTITSGEDLLTLVSRT